jgi:hypothetical protein
MQLPPQVASVVRQIAGPAASLPQGAVGPCKFTGDELLGHPQYGDPTKANYTHIYCGGKSTHWCYCKGVKAYECCPKGCSVSSGICTCDP